MKTILVLTDFSPAADNAARYAFELARALRLRVRLCHTLTNSEPELSADQWSSYIEKIQKGFRPRSGEVMHPPVTFACEIVDVETAAAKSALENHSPLVVMGMTGAGRRKDSWGSHVSAMLNSANIPLLLVPEKASYKRVERIGYATDLSDKELPIIRSVITLARDFRAAVDFWYITEAQASQQPATQKLDDLLKQVVDYSSSVKVSVRSHTAEDAAQGLEWVAKNASMQILVMNHDQHALLEHQVPASQTLTLARRIDIPLLVYPKNAPPSALTIF